MDVPNLGVRFGQRPRRAKQSQERSLRLRPDAVKAQAALDPAMLIERRKHATTKSALRSADVVSWRLH
jgi:hypothetical protein